MWAIASAFSGCAHVRTWKDKHVLCRYAKDVSVEEFVDRQDMHWEAKDLAGKVVLCVSKKLGDGRLGR